MQSISEIRRDYKLKTLDEKTVFPDPIKQFDFWWNEALTSSIDEVNAMTLATSDLMSVPSARTVLLKDFSENGFIFFTNYLSKKGKQLAENPRACLLFFWKELERQVRINGIVEKISENESDEYFETRPAASKAGAWASEQSKVISSREELENNFIKVQQQYPDNDIPRPGHWGGYIVRPLNIEFWQGRPSRLHDRLLYTKNESGWIIERLSP